MVKLLHFASLAALVTLALVANAAPHHPSKPSTTPLFAANSYNNDVKRSVFVTDVPAGLQAKLAGQSPELVGLTLAQHLLPVKTAGINFVVREDSYFDEAAGVWHVYLKQMINGLQVFNGGLHAVVSEADGTLLSYSHNLWDRKAPVLSSNAASASSCHGYSKRSQRVFSSLSAQIISPEAALYGFMALASPDAALSSAFIVAAQTEQATPGFSSAAPQQGSKKISGVPTTTGDVGASMSYVISGDCLVLAHRLEVPLESNSYEAYIDSVTGELRAVADWTSGGLERTPSLARPDFTSYQSTFKHTSPQDLGRPDFSQHETIASSEEDETKEPSYRVFRWGENDPSEGKRSYESARRDPEVSPYGWQAHPKTHHPFSGTRDSAMYVDGDLVKYKDTRGNNVFVSWGGISNEDAFDPALPRPAGTIINGSRTFDYPYPWRKADLAGEQLDPKVYANASQVQLFYTINEFHDLLVHYGFDGPSGNFEEVNKQGGKDGDPVIAFAQSKAGSNNADFTTPPDGRSGRMRMYTWSGHPQRDGSFEEGIVLHEYTHGVSTRLTGGPSDSSCLGWGESGGMGEGWGDVLATLARDRNGTALAFSMGAWASNSSGIRHYPYSRNITINPDTYATLNKPGYWAVHQAGSVWATILLDVVEHAKEELGFSKTLFPPSANSTKEALSKFYLTEEEVEKSPTSSLRVNKKRPIPRHGNTLLLQLILDGMKLQPCRPDFLEARTAIVKADKMLTGGANECLLWHAFAKRGLGTKASVVGKTPWGGGVHTDSHDTPTYCNGTHHL